MNKILIIIFCFITFGVMPTYSAVEAINVSENSIELYKVSPKFMHKAKDSPDIIKYFTAKGHSRTLKVGNTLDLGWLGGMYYVVPIGIKIPNVELDIDPTVPIQMPTITYCIISGANATLQIDDFACTCLDGDCKPGILMMFEIHNQ